ncbi:MAG: hypothetical protein K1X85_07565 [Ignavibacteria bacterium]|nr:hypothetical protein [Ignavibacteria bacterium]
MKITFPADNLQAMARKNRTVMLSGKLLSVMNEYYKAYGPKEYLFLGQHEERYSTRSIREHFKQDYEGMHPFDSCTAQTVQGLYVSSLTRPELLIVMSGDFIFIKTLMMHQ